MIKYRVHDVGAFIDRQLIERKWTHQELADRIKVKRSAVTQWRSGKTKNIKMENIVALAETFGITTDKLLTGKDTLGTKDGGVVRHYGAALPREEQDVLDKYRLLPPEMRRMFRGIIEVILGFGNYERGKAPTRR